MKTLSLLPALFGLCLFLVPRPQEREAQADQSSITPIEPLADFAPLVGKTWRGSFPGGAMHDIQEFEWMLGGKFLRNVHRVTQEDGTVVYEGETVYGWDHAAEELRWWYFNTTGGQVLGNAVLTEGRWVAEGENRGPAGQVGRVRSELSIQEEGWTSTSYFLEGGEWKERFTMQFEEVEDDAEPGTAHDKS